VYNCDDLLGYRLVLTDNTFAWVRSGNFHTCCDTLALGTWQHEAPGFISLSSPDTTLNIELGVLVQEDQRVPSDSVVFLVDNPIEENKRRLGQESADLVRYEINLELADGSFIQLKSQGLNVLVAHLPIRAKINRFMLYIMPGCGNWFEFTPFNYLGTPEYQVADPNTNRFKIVIPSLTYGYWGRKRLKTDYVKVLDENTLLWDGKKYVRGDR
jgi:hypothetical protein